MEKERKQRIWKLLLENQEIDNLEPPATEEEVEFFNEMNRLMLTEEKESIYQKRASRIYQLAINNQEISALEPPVSREEKILYDYIVSKTAQAKKNQKTIIWEIPFDI